jgi:hypothetical protein
LRTLDGIDLELARRSVNTPASAVLGSLLCEIRAPTVA